VSVTAVSASTVGAYVPPKKRKRQLQELLDKYKGETTMGKMVMMGTLREYVRRQDPFIVKDEIRDITDVDDLNILTGVGLKGFLWYELARQKARCMGL